MKMPRYSAIALVTSVAMLVCCAHLSGQDRVGYGGSHGDAVLESELDEWWETHSSLPRLTFGNTMRQGSVGVIPSSARESYTGFVATKVFQVLSNNELLLEVSIYRPESRVYGRVVVQAAPLLESVAHVYVSGISTNGLADGQSVAFPGPLKVDGTYSYESPIGKRTVYKLTPARIEIPAKVAERTRAAALAKAKASEEAVEYAKLKAAEAAKKARLERMRAFTIKSSDGSLKTVRASFLSFSDGKYTLELESGETVSYSARELSARDLAYIRDQVRNQKR